MAPKARHVGRLFWRALRLRCPNCGGGPIRSSWLRMRPPWPTPPWAILQYGGIALMVVAPFLFFPFSKTLFLAFDLVFRPARPDELT
ncbi:MAG: hypothetical protein M3477_08695 [Gemmatimonadota bacterium]|nr:hypothetical protein [Gemmatimonadota bacterium]